MTNAEAIAALEPKTSDSGSITCMNAGNTHDRTTDDCISRQDAIAAIDEYDFDFPQYMERFIAELRDAMKADLKDDIKDLPSAQPEEVIPRRNYKLLHLSDYWCECGWHLGKKGEVKYCPDCGRKVNWE